MSEFESGHIIDGRYRVRREIGRGGMGVVLEVERLEDGRAFALKWCRLGGAWLKRFARTARCSSVMLEYCTGISQPPNSTIRPPSC